MLTTFERGILQGQRKAALRLLEKKFGPLSPEVRQRVEALAPEHVDQLFDAVIESQSLKDLHLEA